MSHKPIPYLPNFPRSQGYAPPLDVNKQEGNQPSPQTMPMASSHMMPMPMAQNTQMQPGFQPGFQPGYASPGHLGFQPPITQQPTPQEKKWQANWRDVKQLRPSMDIWNTGGITDALHTFIREGKIREIYSKDGKTKVGKISKQWSGFAREAFTDAESFGITFPMDLDVRVKAVLLGACFLIDFMFFEKSGH